jgi:hypothetical protein
MGYSPQFYAKYTLMLPVPMSCSVCYAGLVVSATTGLRPHSPSDSRTEKIAELREAVAREIASKLVPMSDKEGYQAWRGRSGAGSGGAGGTRRPAPMPRVPPTEPWRPPAVNPYAPAGGVPAGPRFGPVRCRCSSRTVSTSRLFGNGRSGRVTSCSFLSNITGA